MYKDMWVPEYIVGITRGGNIPAAILSNMLDIRCESLKVALRDHARKNESNTWMAEDAVAKRKNILVVDDINDSGATFKWIRHDWCLNDQCTNVRFAVLTENLSSEFQGVNYWAHEVNKAEDDVWLVYPWENVGKYRDE
ncbi:uncharacterized protein METZ01_LOCUS96820 [marine metagenome]|uniref:Phosphoribosyltransferase domain-containing protein n=1 Tax=marine metagenome TaxID=408172 RepID=A0A381VUH6_9ZZZZ